MKKILKYLGYILLVLLLLLVGAYFAIQQVGVQNWLTQKVVARLQNKLGTKVEVKHIKVDFLNHLQLQGVCVQDKQEDTLLYAGQLEFRITDWFFLKKEKPVIHYLGLSDAQVFLNRTSEDSIWNYEFIANAFASAPDTTQPTTNATTSASSDTSMAFDLKEVKLQRLQFKSIDKWVGEDIIASIDNLALDANKIDWKVKWIDLQKCNIAKAAITYNEYDGGRGYRPTKKDNDSSAFNPDNWRVTLKDFVINNTNFAYNKGLAAPTPHTFDPEHIVLNGINLDLDELVLVGDTIKSRIRQLQAQDRCGFGIKNLQANALVNPMKSELSNLQITTNHSKIQNYYCMEYSRFPDFTDYVAKVVMKAKLQGSKISMHDVGFFAPAVRRLLLPEILLSGNVEGTVANLYTTGIDLRMGSSRLQGDLAMKGLPDINTTYITLQSKNLTTSGGELLRYIPELNKANVAWRDLTAIKYVGSYKGYINDFTTDGTLTTNQGIVRTNLHMTFFEGKQPTYDGYFSTTNLRLGKIIKQQAVGNLSASGEVHGVGFDLSNMNTSFNGVVNEIETPQYTFKNVNINGKLAKETFVGKIVSNDPNLALNFDGAFQLNNSNPTYKLKTEVVKFDLKKLGLTQQSIEGSARIDVNCTGNNIDNFRGRAKLYDLHLRSADKDIYLDSAILTSRPQGNMKNFELVSSAADATLTGNFDIEKLPDAMLFFLNNYLPQYIPKSNAVRAQQLELKLHTKDIDDLLQTFAPSIKACNNATINASLNTDLQQLNLIAAVPHFAYDKINIHGVNANVVGNIDSLNIIGSTAAVINDATEYMPNSKFKMAVSRDTAVGLITTDGGAYNLKDVMLNMKGYAAKDNFFLNILPSNFYFHDSRWNMFTQDYVQFFKTAENKVATQRIRIPHLMLENGLQTITLQTEGTMHENLQAHIENIDVEELNKFSATPIKMEGRINGDIAINNFLSQPAISGNIATTPLKWDGEELGQIFADAEYDKEQNKVSINESSGLLYKDAKTKCYGTIELNGDQPILDLHARLNNTNLRILENFFPELIANTRGVANGNIDIAGPANSYALDARIAIADLSTKVVYLGTTYTIPKGTIVANEHDINLGNMQLLDQLGNTAALKGHIYHNRFSDVRFGKEFGEQNPLTITSKKFQFLNTNAIENELYYGSVIADGAMFLSGPLDNLNMDITATTLQGTKLTLPIRGSFDANKYDYIRFRKYTEDDAPKEVKKDNNRLFINLGITATPDAEITILMDPVTREDIVGRGNGYINMSIDLDNEVKMNGEYTITKGDYGFTFREIIRKPLTIEPGGTIKWDGKPLEAKLDMQASYKVKTNLLPLLGSDASNASKDEKIDYETFAIIKLDGPMLTPTITYDITQPNNNDISGIGYNKLRALRNSKEAVLTQVASLILSHQFINTEGGLNTGTVNSTLLNTASGIVAPTLSNLLTQSISKVINAKDLKIDLTYSNSIVGNTGSADVFSYNIRKGYFNNRLTIEIGDNVDYVRGSAGAKYDALPSNFKLRYLLQPDGKLSLNMFRNSFTNVGSTERDDRNGMGLSYNKSFDNLNEIWRKTVGPVYEPDTPVGAN